MIMIRANKIWLVLMITVETVVFGAIIQMNNGVGYHLKHFPSPLQLERMKRQSGPMRGKFRGQTQSQYLNFGDKSEEGKAEAEATQHSSRATVAGTNGMGQAQSQSSGIDCSDCYGSNGSGLHDIHRPDPIRTGSHNGFSSSKFDKTEMMPGKQEDKTLLYRTPDIRGSDAKAEERPTLVSGRPSNGDRFDPSGSLLPIEKERIDRPSGSSFIPSSQGSLQLGRPGERFDRPGSINSNVPGSSTPGGSRDGETDRPNGSSFIPSTLTTSLKRPEDGGRFDHPVFVTPGVQGLLNPENTGNGRSDGSGGFKPSGNGPSLQIGRAVNSGRFIHPESGIPGASDSFSPGNTRYERIDRPSGSSNVISGPGYSQSGRPEDINRFDHPGSIKPGSSGDGKINNLGGTFIPNGSESFQSPRPEDGNRVEHPGLHPLKTPGSLIPGTFGDERVDKPSGSSGLLFSSSEKPEGGIRFDRPGSFTSDGSPIIPSSAGSFTPSPSGFLTPESYRDGRINGPSGTIFVPEGPGSSQFAKPIDSNRRDGSNSFVRGTPGSFMPGNSGFFYDKRGDVSQFAPYAQGNIPYESGGLASPRAGSSGHGYVTGSDGKPHYINFPSSDQTVHQVTPGGLTVLVGTGGGKQSVVGPDGRVTSIDYENSPGPRQTVYATPGGLTVLVGTHGPHQTVQTVLPHLLGPDQSGSRSHGLGPSLQQDIYHSPNQAEAQYNPGTSSQTFSRYPLGSNGPKETQYTSGINQYSSPLYPSGQTGTQYHPEDQRLPGIQYGSKSGQPYIFNQKDSQLLPGIQNQNQYQPIGQMSGQPPFSGGNQYFPTGGHEKNLSPSGYQYRPDVSGQHGASQSISSASYPSRTQYQTGAIESQYEHPSQAGQEIPRDHGVSRGQGVQTSQGGLGVQGGYGGYDQNVQRGPIVNGGHESYRGQGVQGNSGINLGQGIQGGSGVNGGYRGQNGQVSPEVVEGRGYGGPELNGAYGGQDILSVPGVNGGHGMYRGQGIQGGPRVNGGYGGQVIPGATGVNGDHGTYGGPGDQRVLTGVNGGSRFHGGQGVYGDQRSNSDPGIHGDQKANGRNNIGQEFYRGQGINDDQRPKETYYGYPETQQGSGSSTDYGRKLTGDGRIQANAQQYVPGTQYSENQYPGSQSENKHVGMIDSDRQYLGPHQNGASINRQPPVENTKDQDGNRQKVPADLILDGQRIVGHPSKQPHNGVFDGVGEKPLVDEQYGTGQDPTQFGSKTKLPQELSTNGGKTIIKDDDSEDDAFSQAESSIKNGEAIASAQGRKNGGTAQTQVSGTYGGSGSFSASAQTSDKDRAAQAQITGGKDGALSSSQGTGGVGKSQAQVNLNTKTGGTSATSQSGGLKHESQSEVQANEKGGLADAQANGPGQTSSQAQIGFRPQNEDNDNQKTIFNGGGSASAQSSAHTGQSQSQINGNFKYGISYHGAAQSASGTKEQVKQYRENNRQLFQSIADFGKENSDTNSSSESDVDTETNDDMKAETETDNMKTRKSHQKTVASFLPEPQTKLEEDPEYEEEDEEYDEEYDYSTDKTLEPKSSKQKDKEEKKPEKIVDVTTTTAKSAVTGNINGSGNGKVYTQQHTPSQKQTAVIINANLKHNLVQTQNGKSVFYPSTTEKLPGFINIGHLKDHNELNATKHLKANQERKKYTPKQLPRNNDLKNIHSDHRPNSDSYVTVTKSISGSLDENNKLPNIESTYYTKSSTCGYFTFSCNIVYGSNGRSKICRPKAPTNGKC